MREGNPKNPIDNPRTPKGSTFKEGIIALRGFHSKPEKLFSVPVSTGKDGKMRIESAGEEKKEPPDVGKKISEDKKPPEVSSDVIGMISSEPSPTGLPPEKGEPYFTEVIYSPQSGRTLEPRNLSEEDTGMTASERAKEDIARLLEEFSKRKNRITPGRGRQVEETLGRFLESFYQKDENKTTAPDVVMRTNDRVRRLPYEETREWVQANITSIQRVVQKGEHSTLYYPASGLDIVRPLTAYDVDHLLLVDIDPQRVGEAEKQVRELGIDPRVEVLADGKRREVTFEMDGRQRRITEVHDDARLVTLQSFGLEQVDILHIQAPTGAEFPISKDGVDYDGLHDRLTPANYEIVAEGGFFVFGESKLISGGYEIPPVLLEMVGLEEKQITSRHPYTTQSFATPEDLQGRDRTGYVYKKARTVESSLINVFNEAALSAFRIQYEIQMFEMGRLRDFDKAAGYEALQEEVGTLAQQFAAAHVEQSLIDKFKTDMLALYTTKFPGM